MLFMLVTIMLYKDSLKILFSPKFFNFTYYAYIISAYKTLVTIDFEFKIFVCNILVD